MSQRHRSAVFPRVTRVPKTLAIPPPSSAEDAFAHASARGDEQYSVLRIAASRWERFHHPTVEAISAHSSAASLGRPSGPSDVVAWGEEKARASPRRRTANGGPWPVDRWVNDSISPATARLAFPPARGAERDQLIQRRVRAASGIYRN